MTAPDPLRHLAGDLAELERSGLLRSPEDGAADLLVLCSNDYLGYGAEPWPVQKTRESAGIGANALASGSGASRLVSGEHPAHKRTEGILAEWVRAEAALLFSSGYAANVGTLAALAGPADVVISDALNHASLIDGCRLSGARIVVVPHRDLGAMHAALSESSGARRRWVVTESYFSMDGDIPDLGRLREACDRWDAALVVDEAHAFGIFGPNGSGLCVEAGIRADVRIGTLGKAFGLQGAFVAGSALLRAWLWNRARTFVFSTGVSPVIARAIEERVTRVAGDDPGRRRLFEVAGVLRKAVEQVTGPGSAGVRGPIIPWVVGAPEAAVRLSRRLRERGILVQAIRPPTVPPGTSRLRLTAQARLTDGEVERVLRALAWASGTAELERA
jgi:8-amino-7-oxononanoate synthase